ncbi:MAG: molybdopterin-dependent oxidoreductase [Polyangiaceae bacterium]
MDDQDRLSDRLRGSELEKLLARRRFIKTAAVGTVITAFGGGLWTIVDDLIATANAKPRDDGRPRVPPGQRVISALKPMGGAEGSPLRSKFKLKIHGEVEHPFEVDFRGLLKLPQVTQKADVHCVTGWTVLDANWKGVRIKDLADKAKLKKTARYAIIEAAHGYTANVPIREALKDSCMVTYELDGDALAEAHGAPARGLIPDLYFWKSSKWITGIRFVKQDDPGYWETRGYHNRGNPWLEERYS